ncbi:alpha-N-acetylglucosaminidase [Ruania halotolerans]|uniref:alpha-N-acetylglucosaminidase n=1 Tax=Ruania halotolerans TaxID=2897773 RepID=UPI001E283338|nr:alpha-N-acetylglucosaminidase [Ruania halotolerans]UFU06145.1 alpha-N-acetylglucosaminidase [Ruania halotolerans]
MTTPVNAHAVEQLALRVLGHAKGLRVTHGDGESPGYEYAARDGVVQVRATDTPAACAGLYAYLKDVCGVQVTWDSALPLSVDGAWPDAAPVRRSTPAQHRYYLNVVTTGYSAPYWDWERWEREIDWMALHGITTPLMMVAHEAVLARAFTEQGAAPGDVRAWLGSAAHLPWTLMGCTNALGGPLPASWFDQRLSLAQRILARQRELGMRAVLPAFGGHVPDSLAGADTPRTTWQGFSTALLDACEPRFANIADAVARAQTELLGTDHLYSADPFIESIPPTGEPERLAEHTRAVYAGMAATDPDAIWVMQGWPFHYHRQFWTTERIAAVTGAVPAGRLLVLDLWAEHAPVAGDGRGISSTPWLWSAVHNFGGRFSVHGDLHGLTRDLGGVLDAAREGQHQVGQLVGTGLAMEAIENNPVFYELATDLTWHTPEVETWVRDYAWQRYDLADAPPSAKDAASRAWDLLVTTLYRPGASRSIPSPLIARPWDVDPPFARQRSAGEFLDPDAPVLISANIDAESDPTVEGDLPAIAESAGHLLEVASHTGATPALANDLVDVLTHLIAQRSRATIRALSAAAQAADPDGVAHHGGLLTRALADLDRLAGTQRERLLGTWLTDAARWGADAGEQQTLVRDARRLLTVWAKQTSGLHDYSGRHWAGLLGGFYSPRWQIWIDWLTQVATHGGQGDLTELRDAVVRFEESWADEVTIGPTEPSGDLTAIATELVARYREPIS